MRILKITAFLFAIIVTQRAAAQKLTLYKTFGGVVYQVNDSVQLSVKQVRILLRQNEQAYNEFKKARVRSTFSGILGFWGVALLTIPLIEISTGKTPEWIPVGTSLAMFTGSFFLNRAYKARALYAADLYNAGIPYKKTARIKPEFYFYGTGAKLVIKF